jgi:hypothetical protein
MPPKRKPAKNRNLKQPSRPTKKSLRVLKPPQHPGLDQFPHPIRIPGIREELQPIIRTRIEKKDIPSIPQVKPRGIPGIDKRVYPTADHILWTTQPNPDVGTPDLAAICHHRTAFDATSVVPGFGVDEWVPILKGSNRDFSREVAFSGMVVFDEYAGGPRGANDFSADMPFSHPFYNDWELSIAVDSPYQQLLWPGAIEAFVKALDPEEDVKDKGVDENIEADEETQNALEGAQRIEEEGGAEPFRVEDVSGILGLEIDRGLIPHPYRAQAGDRVAGLGRWIVDCGHNDPYRTEIHPPLLLARGFKSPDGDGTEVLLISRAFLVSQDFNGNSLGEHLSLELMRINGEAAAAALFPPALAAVPPITAKPAILSPPFEGIQLLVFNVSPPTPRQSPDDRLLLSYHFTGRTGVAVQVADASAPGQPEKVAVAIVMNDVLYVPAETPPHHEISVSLDDFRVKQADAWAAFVASGTLGSPVTGPILARGLKTERYDLSPPASPKDNENPIEDVEIGNHTISAEQSAAISTDDQQPYPIYGHLKLHWERH